MKSDSLFPPGFALIVALGLASWSARQLQARPHADPGSVIRPSTLAVFLGEVADGSRTTFEVLLANTGSSPVKIVGSPSLCGRHGCVNATNLPAIIPPHRSVAIRYDYLAEMAGTFDLKSTIYLDLGGRVGAEMPISFRGSVREPTETP